MAAFFVFKLPAIICWDLIGFFFMKRIFYAFNRHYCNSQPQPPT
jgi:hypothetical protein